MDKQKSIATLQAYATGLAAQSLQHKVEGKIFADQGFTKLGEKYAEHAAAPEMPVFTDPVEYIKSDLAVSHEQVPILMQLVLSLQDDFKTYDILRAYALDEEEDMLWSETQLDLIEKIGLQNWLVKQL